MTRNDIASKVAVDLKFALSGVGIESKVKAEGRYVVIDLSTFDASKLVAHIDRGRS